MYDLSTVYVLYMRTRDSGNVCDGFWYLLERRRVRTERRCGRRGGSNLDQHEEMKKVKGWHHSDSFEIDVVAMTETKAHLVCRNVRRLREDGSLIEEASAFYAFKKTGEGWKMFAISDVVNPAS